MINEDVHWFEIWALKKQFFFLNVNENFKSLSSKQNTVKYTSNYIF